LTCVIGLPLERAKELLVSEGFIVSAEEARSKKGVPDASEARVIRQTHSDGSHVMLVYSVFRTDPAEQNS
jgi:hypothetical protein